MATAKTYNYSGEALRYLDDHAAKHGRGAKTTVVNTGVWLHAAAPVRAILQAVASSALAEFGPAAAFAVNADGSVTVGRPLRDDAGIVERDDNNNHVFMDGARHNFADGPWITRTNRGRVEWNVRFAAHRLDERTVQTGLIVEGFWSDHGYVPYARWRWGSHAAENPHHREPVSAFDLPDLLELADVAGRAEEWPHVESEADR